MAGAFSSAFSSAFDIDVGAAASDTHDGAAPWEYETADEIRRRLNKAEESRELSRRKRKDAEQKLADELDRAYRRIVLKEPEIAAEVAAVVVPSAKRGEPDKPATIDFRKLSNLIESTEAVLAILERDRQEAVREEDDIEILLLAIA